MIMQFMNLNKADKPYSDKNQGSESLVTNFSKWADELISLLQRRAFGDSFADVMQYCLALDDYVITRLTDEEKEQQLIFCSQYKATFLCLRDEIELYLNRVERKYVKWKSFEYNKTRDKLLEEYYQLFLGKKIPKTEIKVTKDEVKSRFVVDQFDENEKWQNFMDDVKRALNLMKNLVADIENRSMILMSLRKKQMY